MIVDAHIHLGYTANFFFPDPSLQGILTLMDDLGVDLAISATMSLLSGRWEEGLEETLDAYRQSGGRILGYAVYSPHHPESLSSVETCLDEEAFVGIKIHPSWHECYADDKRWRPIWELAARRGASIMSHSWAVSDYNPVQRYSVPERFESFVAAYPQVALILAHAGGRYEGHRAAAGLARRYPNVYLDLAGDSYSLGLVEWLVQQVGAERLLFGSDLTWIDPRTQIGRILNADISPEAKALILGENARRLFRLEERPAKEK